MELVSQSSLVEGSLEAVAVAVAVLVPWLKMKKEEQVKKLMLTVVSVAVVLDFLLEHIPMELLVQLKKLVVLVHLEHHKQLVRVALLLVVLVVMVEI